MREIITLLSATLAALVALITLPWTAGVARAFFDPEWAGDLPPSGIPCELVTNSVRRGWRLTSS